MRKFSELSKAKLAAKTLEKSDRYEDGHDWKYRVMESGSDFVIAVYDESGRFVDYL